MAQRGDNGNTWQTLNNGLTSLYVTSIEFKGTDIYLGTDDGLFLSTNGGNNWTFLALPFIAISDILVNGNDIFVGTTTNGVFLSQNGGPFDTINTGLTNLWTNNLTMKGSDLFVSTRGGVFRSVNYGSSWTMISGGAFSISYSIEIANDSSTLFVTADPGVWKSENNGALWTQISNGITMPYGNCMSINGDTLFYGSFTGLFRSYDRGNTWTSVGLNVGGFKYMKKKGDVILAATPAIVGIFISKDGGSNWRYTLNNLPFDTYFSGTIADSAIIIGSANHGVYRSLDTGATWQQVNNGITSMWIPGMTNIGPNIIAGTTYGVFYSNNNGLSWVPRNNGIASPQMIGEEIACNSKFFISSFTGIYSSNDFGLSWDSISFPLPLTMISTSENRVMASCQCGPGISRYVSDDEGVTWMPAVGDLPLIATTTAIKDSTLFLGTQTDGVHYSTDDGLHWSPINVGLQNLDIFTLEVLDNYLYASTHGGLYRLNLDSMITNTKEIAASTFLEVYPNPTSGNVTINVNNGNAINSIRIFDLPGRLVYSNENISEENKTLRLKLNSGLYIINYKDRNGSISRKIIVD
ncbi:MAG: T9SS type A sorting domain-containing protein [Bacteroidetes bacterium]|nr:T9SS type A sorting domain-containing protein [Bacteroidota bacterium]